MIKIFDRLPRGASPAYEVGTSLGVFFWDQANKSWMAQEVEENAKKKGYYTAWLPRFPLLPSLEDAKEELRCAEEAVPPGLGMVVSWSDYTDGVFLTMAAAELADLEYGEPAWAR